MKLANRVLESKPYIFERMGKQKQLVEAASGRRVIDLGAGSPDVAPAEQRMQDLQEILGSERDLHKYPGYGALPQLTMALQGYYEQIYNVSLEPVEIQPLLGAKDGIAAVSMAVLDRASRVLVPDPGYQGYPPVPEMLEAQVVKYNLTERDFQLDFVDLEKKIKLTDTRLLWVNFPSNPTGAEISLADLEKVVALAKRHQVVLAYDNAYSEVKFDGGFAPSIMQVPGAKEIAVEIGSLSKNHSFAGFRIGYMVGNPRLIQAVRQIKSNLDSGLSKHLQLLAAEALTNPDLKWREKMLASYKRRRNILAGKLAQMGLKFTLPEAGLYLWAEVPNEFASGEAFAEYLLKEKQVLVTPGIVFGQNGKRFIRASFCVNLEAINEYLP